MSNGAVLVLQPLGLPLAVNPGESYRTVLSRFNAYRSPYSQITSIRTPAGIPISLDDPIHGYTIVHMTEAPIPSPHTYRPAPKAETGDLKR
jgi:hypothetical protein